MMELTNSFHGTKMTVAMTEADILELERIIVTGNGEELRAAKATVRRIRNKLCGCSDCTCGDFLGRRN